MITNKNFRESVFSAIPFFFIALLILMKVVFAQSGFVDSDEPQHLHVIWGWANGLLQYRDIFDNHAPLFHMLFTPVYAFFGERPNILVLMRFAIIPLFFVALWAVYTIGRHLFSKEAGLWAAIFTGLYPDFFLTSSEFRTDDLWMVFWLLALAVLVRRPLRIPQIFLAGLLLGATISVSMKTSLLLLALALATFGSIIMLRPADRLPVKQYGINSLWLVAGLLIVPLVLVLYFSIHNALGPMYYSVIAHNIVPGLGHWAHLETCVLPTLGFLLLSFYGTNLLRHSCDDKELLQRRTVIFLTFGLAMACLYAFWPLITREDFLPLTPLFTIMATGMLMEKLAYKKSSAWKISRPLVILVIMALLELGLLISEEKPWTQHESPKNSYLSEVLLLTRPGETIMDLKGETVFRRRPFFYVLEGITRKRIKFGLIKDSIPEDIVRNVTTVATLDDSSFPARGREFLNNNFLVVGQLRVVGQLLAIPINGQNQDMSFDIHVPTNYELMAESGVVSGWLDGIPYRGSRQLDAGHHTFRLSSPLKGKLAVIWAPAIQRGFSPFVMHYI
ncbi:MAG: ArnT family glycosyltransferase [Methylotenera sp.]